MNRNNNRFETLLYWLIFTAGALTAGYHTYAVIAPYNPWFIAVTGAVSVDVMLAYTMHNIRRWTGDKRAAATAGIILFTAVSGLAQVIYYQVQGGAPLEPWLQFVATYIIPIASATGSIVAVSLIQLFDANRNGVPDFMEHKQKNQREFGMSQYRPQEQRQSQPQSPVTVQDHSTGNGRVYGQESAPDMKLVTKEGRDFTSGPRT